MSASSNSGRLRFDVNLPRAQPSDPIDEDSPLRMVVLGAFRGDSPMSEAPVRAIRVDIDNLDQVFASFQATVLFPPSAGETATAPCTFGSLDDFHPDSLLQRVEPLATLMRLRKRLQSPDTSAAALGELNTRVAAKEAPSTASSAPATPSKGAESSGDTLSRLLGRQAVDAPGAKVPKTPANQPTAFVENLLRQASASTSVPVASMELTQGRAQLDLDIAARLRALLHHRAFQALEATWRGLDLLVREAGDEVHLHVIDLNRHALVERLSQNHNPLASLVGRQLEALAPSVMVAAYTFDLADLPALAACGRLAAALRTGFIAGAAPGVVGCPSFATTPHALDWIRPASPAAEAFNQFRGLAEAAHVGLALPRFLVRQPYGRESDPIEGLPFEEISGPGEPDSFLWGNPAFLCGHVLINAFMSEGWNLEPTAGEVQGLPVHLFKEAGESRATPCAEAWLSERDAEAILACGCMPVLSFRGRDSVLLPSLRALAKPASVLPLRRP